MAVIEHHPISTRRSEIEVLFSPKAANTQGCSYPASTVTKVWAEAQFSTGRGIFSPARPDRLWSALSLLLNEWMMLFALR